MFGVSVSGIADSKRKIDKVMDIVSDSTTEGLTEIGERGTGFLKLETPVDSGRLRSSMSYTIDNKVYSPLGNPSGKDKLRKQRAKDEVDIGTNVIYAPHVEYLAKNGSAGFMLRAYRLTKQVATMILAKTIKGGVE